MRLLLAPMEGLLDEVLRAVLTHSGGYDYAVTEFARVSGTVLPARFFRRLAPELNTASRTLGGTPVHVQLLGSDPACMGDSAAQLASLAPAGVDLNFGCPAQTVNRHRGGAVLLDDPELLHRIAVAVRAAVPATIALSAKMRLGVGDTGRAIECAQAFNGEVVSVDSALIYRHLDIGSAKPSLAERQGVPITNYGVAISRVQGVLHRSLGPFPSARIAFERASAAH